MAQLSRPAYVRNLAHRSRSSGLGEWKVSAEAWALARRMLRLIALQQAVTS
jgi:hypothetical protein